MGCTVGDLIHFGATMRVSICANISTAGVSELKMKGVDLKCTDDQGNTIYDPTPNEMPSGIYALNPDDLIEFERGNESVNVYSLVKVCALTHISPVRFFEVSFVDGECINVKLRQLVIMSNDLKMLQKLHMDTDTDSIEQSAYISPDLATLIRAAQRFWSNADPSDKDSHTINSIVADWLMGQGLSKAKADAGASIIRPEWAAKGRPAEK